MTETSLPRGVVPPGTYAQGGRSPVVYALLCASCAGYAPTVREDYPPLPQCQGCGAYVREVHRFQALIMSAANGGCMCTTEHPQVTGDLPAEWSAKAVMLEVQTRPAPRPAARAVPVRLICEAGKKNCFYCHAGPGSPCVAAGDSAGYHLSRFIDTDLSPEDARLLGCAATDRGPGGVIWATDNADG